MAYKIYIQITYISGCCCCFSCIQKRERYSYAALEVGSVQFVVLVVVAVAGLRFTFKTFTFT